MSIFVIRSITLTARVTNWKILKSGEGETMKTFYKTEIQIMQLIHSIIFKLNICIYNMKMYVCIYDNWSRFYQQEVKCVHQSDGMLEVYTKMV